MQTLPIPPQDDNQLMVERQGKLTALRATGIAFPNDIKPEHRAEALFALYDSKTKEELEPLAISVNVAGRMMLKRVMGKASFATLQDASFGPSGGRIQVYINNEGVGEDVHHAFKHWDLGDIVWPAARCSKPKPASCRFTPRPSDSSRKACAPCPTSFTAWPTRKSNTVSAMLT